ncbi:TRAP transporter substrate-binding protein DctP [Desulfobotulus sp. H1]|uniref:TRAP transporter substrate-binding protein DctP n=1 Tax=Desulfobotulus pelophilus TaxID=2823377 RepID=A0ABT3N9W6_9BACT|nr:TRAP transporter substrate-binding protein DctP [Desulfobotulus pelophilus]MCW7754258.1 TRAP transporter substrate-binding protein DctP [Desulfobotulus pelophilus]
MPIMGLSLVVSGRCTGAGRFLLLACFLGLFPVGAGWADVPKLLPVMRISIENTATHTQTRAVRRFAEDLADRTRGRLRVELYDSARLYRDSQVLGALAADRVEMAVPGTWHFDRYEPSVGIFLLPSFYGRSAEAMHAIVDGETGRRVTGKIEERLSVVVPGRWLDLGHAHIYAVRPVTSREDMDGLTIRVAGGLANSIRLEAMGARPLVVPWPDLPARLQQGDIEGVLTTHETMRSARLWEFGLLYAFEDRQYFPQYIPVIRRNFWRRLPDDLRRLVKDTWESHVEMSRKEAGIAQEEARKLLMEHGMRIHRPSEALLIRYRQLLMLGQEAMVTLLDVDPELYADTLRLLEGQDGESFLTESPP